MSLAKKARVVERDILGALIGLLVSLVLCRLAALVVDIHLFALATTLVIGVWSGVFVAHLGVRRSIAAMESMKSYVAVIRAMSLRAILWLLGIAAVLGVMSVLTGSFEVVGRVAATSAVTALAAAFLWQFLYLLDADKSWRVGLFGTASVLSAYMLGMPSIWDIGFRTEESALSGLVIALMTPVGSIAMLLTHKANTRVAGFIATLVYAASTTLFLLAIWDAEAWSHSGKLVESGFILLFFAVAAVACAINAAIGDGRFWRWIGVVATAIGCGMTLYGVWVRGGFDEELIITVTSVGVVIAHANLAFLAPLRGGQIWWRAATIVFMIVTAGALDLDLLLDTNQPRGISILGRISLASGILASTGTLAMLILTRMNHSVQSHVKSGVIESIFVRCPKCGKRQTISIGKGICSGCGLGIHIQLDQGEEQPLASLFGAVD